MQKTATTKQTITLFWHFTRQHKLSFWIGTLGAALGTVVQDVLPPLIIARAFNRLQLLSNTHAPLNLAEFYPYIIGYLILLIVGLVVWRVQVWFVWLYEVKTIRKFVIYIFDHLQHMGSSFHANHFGGALVSQTNKFLSAYEKIMDEFSWSIVPWIVAFIASSIVLVTIAPLYALVFAVVCIVYLTIMLRRTIRTMPYDRAVATSESDRTAKLADMITNAAAVTAFAGEAHEKELFTKQAEHAAQAQFTLLRKVMVNDAISQSMTNLISLLAFVSGVVAITIFHSPAGVLFLAVNYTMQMTRRLWESNRVVRNINRALGDANDMTEILQLQPEIKNAELTEAADLKAGSITFDNVNFYYAENKSEPLFNDLSLVIKPGEKIGLVGHSGGGKTTITKLILRFMDIQGGRVLIDNQDIATIKQTDLRKAIAYVPQEPMLFHRSLMDNIRYGQLNATDKQVLAVAKLAHAHEFIKNLPHSYDTLVGERGVKLSGGQRQRIAIARAMLKNAPILVLDEATSALDSESEVLIQDALWKLMEGRTAIVIAHRLSTIQKMDRIIVLDKGKIVEQGTHKELVKHGGTYAQLWAHQSGGFIDE